MKKHSYLSKISRPDALRILPRHRLFQAIDRYRNHPVIYISGPAGAGKTTLVASYIESRKLPCLWYNIDSRDTDFATFFYFMGLAAKKANPRKRRPLPLLTPEYLFDISAFAKRYFEELFSRVKTPYALVMDNYHKVSLAAHFHEVFMNGLELVPDGITVFLLSRNQIPQAFIRLQANQKMCAMGWDEIRFTLDESKDVLKMQMRNELPENVVREIYRKTDGWIAGLILIATKADEGKLDPGSLETLTTVNIFNYFAKEVLEKIDKDQKDFLCKTSLLSQISPDIADKLIGSPISAQILSHLIRSNYFTTRLSDGRVYQYHPLFRQFLLSQLQEKYSGEEIRRLSLDAAGFLLESGEVEEAIHLLLEAKDIEQVVCQILENAPKLAALGRLQTIQSWIEKLPQETYTNIPWLLYWLGISKQSFNLKESLDILEKAFLTFQKQGDFIGALLSWSGVVDAILFLEDNYKPLDFWIAWMDDFARQHNSVLLPNVEAAVSTSMSGALLWRKPEHKDIGEWIKRSIDTSAHEGVPAHIFILSRMHGMFYYAWMGEFYKAKILSDEIARLSKSEDAPPLILISWKLSEMVLFNSIPENYERVVHVMTDAFHIVQESGVHILDHAILSNGIYAAFNSNDLETAGQLLEKMMHVVSRSRRASLAHYLIIKAWHYFLNGELNDAQSHGERALELVQESGSPVPEIICCLSLAQILCEQEKYDDAKDYLKIANTLNYKVRSTHFQYLLYFAEAWVHIKQGNEEEASKPLKRGVAIMRQFGQRSIMYFWRRDVLTRLFTKALNEQIGADYVRDLIRSFALQPVEVCLDSSAWPWPIKIYTLGRFTLVRDGEPVRFSVKAQKKPLLMLKALISLGGREVGEVVLSDLLWPEAYGDIALKSLRMTLLRLRRLLGEEKAIIVQDGKLTINAQYCWVDAWAFGRTLGQIESMLKTGDRGSIKEKVPDLVEQAMEMYHGSFLADEDEPWALSYREHLRERVLRIIGKAGIHLEAAGQHERAIEFYKKLLEIDRLSEEFYRKLMECNYRLGRRSEALATYERCRKVLAKVFGVEPSDETQSLYRSICAHCRK